MMNRAHQLAWRSLTRTCVVCLLGGVVINVAVAWGCALGLDLSSATMAIGTDGPDGLADTWVIRVWTRTGSVRVSSHRFVGVHSSDTTATELVPAWTGYQIPLPQYESRTEPYESRFADAWGWPLLSMWYQTDKAFTPQSTFRAGVRVAGRVLPLRPIWSGLPGTPLCLGWPFCCSLAPSRRVDSGDSGRAAASSAATPSVSRRAAPNAGATWPSSGATKRATHTQKTIGVGVRVRVRCRDAGRLITAGR